jgi:hypothetical protein
VGTNESGFSPHPDKGNDTLLYSYIGYLTRAKQLELQDNRKLEVALAGNATALQEAAVRSRRPDQHVRGMEMSTLKMQVAGLVRIPALLGGQGGESGAADARRAAGGRRYFGFLCADQWRGQNVSGAKPYTGCSALAFALKKTTNYR